LLPEPEDAAVNLEDDDLWLIAKQMASGERNIKENVGI
jgi:hypothetical protein